MARLRAASGALVILLAGACSGERPGDVAALPAATASTGVQETIDPLAGQIVGSREGHGMHGYTTPPLQTLGGAFELVEATKGVPYTEKDLRGSWSLVYFGYMECQEACPIALKTMPAAVARLNAAGIATKAVFIDINAPRLDDMTGGMGHEGHDAHRSGNPDAMPMTGPEIRRAALARWGPGIAPGMTFLSGTRKQVIAANKAFQSRVEAAMMKNEEPIHHINHTTTIYVMDPQGQVAGLVYHSDPVQVMTDAVKALAKGEAAPEATGHHQ